VAQVVECLLNKHKVLNSNFSIAKRKKERDREGGRGRRKLVFF
jgi:hypothetical protein